MKRLTKTYSDGSFGVADDLPCGENSHEFKKLLIDRLGMFEEAESIDEEFIKTGSPWRSCTFCKFSSMTFEQHPCNICDDNNSEWKDGMSND